MVDEHVLGDGLFKSCVTQAQAEVKIFKIPHAKHRVQALELVPGVASNGNAEKVATVSGQEQARGVGIEPSTQFEPLLLGFAGVVQALPIACGIGHGADHGGLGGCGSDHLFQGIDGVGGEFGVVVDQEQPLAFGLLGRRVHSACIPEVARALNEADCGVLLAPASGQVTTAVGGGIVKDDPFQLWIRKPGFQALQAGQGGAFKLPISQHHHTDQRGRHGFNDRSTAPRP